MLGSKLRNLNKQLWGVKRLKGKECKMQFIPKRINLVQGKWDGVFIPVTFVKWSQKCPYLSTWPQEYTGLSVISTRLKCTNWTSSRVSCVFEGFSNLRSVPAHVFSFPSSFKRIPQLLWSLMGFWWQSGGTRQRTAFGCRGRKSRGT